MQMVEELSCNICFRLPKVGLDCANDRCKKLFCKQCYELVIQQFMKQGRESRCPFCRRSQFKVYYSLDQGKINQILVSCRHCKGLKKFKQIQKHELECDQKIIKCQFCDKAEPRRNIVQHTIQTHADKIQLIKELDNSVRPPIYDPAKIHRLKNTQGNVPQLGINSKFYCNGPLGSTKCSCCPNICGPNSGQNCKTCMEFDMVRRGLARGYLVNANGEVCWFDQKGHFTCGVLYSGGHKRCGQGSYCDQCAHLQKTKYRYIHLLPQK